MLAILAIHVVGRTSAYCSPFHADSYAYAAFAYRMAHGEVLYRDLAIDKPPGLLWLEAPVYRWCDVPARWPLIPLESAGMLLGYWAVYRLCRGLYGPMIGMGLSVVATFAINYFLFCDDAIEGFCLAESFMVFPMALAVLHYRRGYLNGRARDFLVAGACLGITLILKQTVVALLAAVAVHRTCFEAFVHRRPRGWFRQGLLLFAGFALVLTVGAVVLVAQGTLAAAWYSMTVRATKALHVLTAWPRGWNEVLPIWTPIAWSVLGLVVWCAHRARRPSTDKSAITSTEDLAFLLLWLACECILLIKLPRHSAHYYAVSFLPLVLLSGVFWVMLKGDVRRADARTRRALIGVVCIWSAACVRLAVDVFLPVTITRVRAYDVAADRDAFARFLTLDDIGMK